MTGLREERTARMLAAFPDFHSVRGREPVKLIRCLATVGEVGMTFGQFARSLLTCGRLDPAIRELVVLRVAWLRACAYIWGGHYLIAADVGLRFPPADGWHRSAALAVAVTDQLVEGSLDPSTRREVTATWGAPCLVELALVVGQYTLVSMVVAALGIEPEPGTPAMPEAWPGPVPPSGARS